MWLFLGVQIFFSSFFLSMLGISRDTYIGDYERHDLKPEEQPRQQQPWTGHEPAHGRRAT